MPLSLESRAEKLRLIPNGCGPAPQRGFRRAALDLPPRLGARRERRLHRVCGTLYAGQGCGCNARFLCRFSPAEPGAIAVGDGGRWPARHVVAAALAADLGLDDVVLWLGAQDARPLMRGFDILALTSKSEGHPLVVLEAMARSLPIVATSVGGIADTVQSGVNGFIVPPGDAGAIVDALEKLARRSRATRAHGSSLPRDLAPLFSGSYGGKHARGL